MTIERYIQRKPYEFVLTDDELFAAYLEQQHIFDRDDCADAIAWLKGEEILEAYGVTYDTFHALLDDMAVEMRRNIDKYDMSWQSARDEAVRDVIAGAAQSKDTAGGS